MAEPKFVKIARVGDIAREVAVTETMTVREAISAAGYDIDSNSTVYGSTENNGNTVVQLENPVNGFTKLAISTNVKGA